MLSLLSIELLLIVVMGMLAFITFIIARGTNTNTSTIKSNQEMLKAHTMHIEGLQKQIKSLTGIVETLTGNVEKLESFTINLKGRLDDLSSELEQVRDHVDRLQKNDQVLVGQLNQLNGQVQSIPAEMNRKIALVNRTLKVEIAPQRTVGKEYIVVEENGKKYKRTDTTTYTLQDKKKFKRPGNIPGIKEAKESFAEAQL